MKKKRCSVRARSARGVLLLFVALAVLSAGAAPARPRITGISHITLLVHDLEAARGFYTRFLGYGEPSPKIIGINNRQYVELVPEREAGSDRLVRIAVQTENAERMRDYLQSRGVAAPERVTVDAAGTRTFVVTDPDGHALEFVQDEPARGTTRNTPTADRAGPISTDLRHIGILVGALDPAMAFYGDLLGFKEIWRGSRDGQELNWVNMQVPEGQDYIEFMLYRDLPGPTRRGTQHHLCLFVPDIEKSLAILRARAAGANYTRAMQINTGTNRKRQLNLYDPDGTRTELMEPMTIDGKPTPSSTASPPRRN